MTFNWIAVAEKQKRSPPRELLSAQFDDNTKK